MEIGSKIKRLRVRLGLTQEELAARTELTKGFISQLERDITSPSIATLMDILEALGTNVSEFFSDREDDGVMTYAADDMFIKADEEAGVTIRWPPARPRSRTILTRGRSSAMCSPASSPWSRGSRSGRSGGGTPFIFAPPGYTI